MRASRALGLLAATLLLGAAPAPGELRLKAGEQPAPASLEGVRKLIGATGPKQRPTCLKPTAGDGPTLKISKGQRLQVEDLCVHAAPGQAAIEVEGLLIFRRLRLVGGRHGLKVKGGRVSGEGLVVRDAQTALWVIDGHAGIKGLDASGGPSRPLIFAARSSLTLAGVKVRGGEYGLLGAPGVRLDLKEVEVLGAAYAGLGLTGAAGEIRGLRVEGGAGGGVLVSDLQGPLRMSKIEIRGVRGVGLQLIRGAARLEDIQVARVSLDHSGGTGHGLYLEDFQGEVEGVRVESIAGVGVLALGGSFSLAKLRCAQVSACLGADRGATVYLGGPATAEALGGKVWSDGGARLRPASSPDGAAR